MKNEIDNRNRRAKNDRQSIVGDNRFITSSDRHKSILKHQRQALYFGEGRGHVGQLRDETFFVKHI
jgi:hypothetical protein